jgi:hypothetical protein
MSRISTAGAVAALTVRLMCAMRRREFLRVAGLVGGAAMLGAPGCAALSGRWSPVMSSAKNVYTVPGGIDRTGATDVTSALQAWIDSVPDGGSLSTPSVLSFPAGCTYRIDGTLRIQNRHNLVFACLSRTPITKFTGEGVVYNESGSFTTAERTRCQWFVKSSTSIKFSRLRAEGSNRLWHYVVGLEGQSAWWLEGPGSGYELDRCEAEWTYGDFVQLQGAGSAYIDGCWIHDCRSDHIGRIQLVTNNVKRCLFENNTVRRQRRSAWDAEPNSTLAVIEDVYIRNNEFTDGGHWEAGGGQPGIPNPMTRVVIQSNRCPNGAMSLTYGLPRGTYPTEFPRRQHIYWVDNWSPVATDFPYALVFNEANFIYAKNNTQLIGPGRCYVQMNRSCGWSASSIQPNNVSRPDGSTGSMYYVQNPCNVTPAPSPVPSGLPPLPADWPFST